MLILTANERFDSRALLTQCLAVRTNRVCAHLCRNDERLSVMHKEGRKCVAWALHNDLIAFHKIQHVDRALCMMRSRSGEPVPPRLDELKRMQPCTFLAPSLAAVQRLDLIDQRRPHPIRGAIP